MVDELRRSGASAEGTDDPRSPYQRDHDRVFYSSEFTRLEGVTQVVTLTANGLHNRLTHSYRVEQVARVIAMSLSKRGHQVDVDVVAAAALAHDVGHAPFGHTGEEALQEVVQCAAHRKQHNTYDGRLGRKVREGVVVEACSYNPPCALMDSFEGNAQSLRIVALLAPKSDSPSNFGLDLMRRTLRATVKYPWLKGANAEKLSKWGAYDCDRETLIWVLDDKELGEPAQQSLEAQIMDTADDIAYAVHDLEDFYKARLIPLANLRVGSLDFMQVLDYVDADPDTSKFKRLREVRKHYTLLLHAQENAIDAINRARTADPHAKTAAVIYEGVDGTSLTIEVAIDQSDQLESALLPRFPLLENMNTLFALLPTEAYSDTNAGRGQVTRMRARLISTFVNDLVVADGELRSEHRFNDSFMEFLKLLTWFFVIDDPDLINIREGQKRVIGDVFESLYEKALNRYIDTEVLPDSTIIYTLLPLDDSSRVLPPRLMDYLRLGASNRGTYLARQVVARAVVDYICSLTDEQTYTLHAQLSGSAAYAVPRALAALRVGSYP